MATHTLLIESIEALGPQIQSVPGIIVEVGSQRHAGRGSSFQLKQLANSIGRKFLTIDADSGIASLAHSVVGECSIHGKGEDVLAAVSDPILCLYLDNYDVIYGKTHAEGLSERIGNHYEQTLGYSFQDANRQNLNSAIFHLLQLGAAFDRLADKCLVAVDDTKLKSNNDFSYYWGKGCAVVPVLLQVGFSIFSKHEEGLVLQRGLI